MNRHPKEKCTQNRILYYQPSNKLAIAYVVTMEGNLPENLIHDCVMKSSTFTMIKPNAVAAGHTGKILDRMTADGFTIRAMRLVFMSRNDAAQFYAVHAGKPFFETLLRFMTSGATVVALLEREGNDAVAALRQLVGNTDPAKADRGTIRAEFGESLTCNAVHASDSDENARIEWSHFFAPGDMIDVAYNPEVFK